MKQENSFWKSLEEFNFKLVMLAVPPVIFLFVIAIIAKIVLLFSVQKVEEVSPKQKQLEQTMKSNCSFSIPTATFPTE